MAFIKKNWQMVACAALALAGIGVSVWQAMASSDVPKLMEPAVQLSNTLESAGKGTLYDSRWIDQKIKDMAESKRRFEATLAEAEQRQRYVAFEEHLGPDGSVVRVERKPLVEGVLPAATQTTPKIEFRKRYREEFKRLEQRLHAGRLPTEAEFQRFQDQWIQLQESKQEGDPWSILPRVAAAEPAADEPMDRFRLLWNDPFTRKSLEQAKTLWMYIDEGAINDHLMSRTEAIPSEVDIWQAQMSLWIQQDLVTALARVNEAAAAELTKAGQGDRVWVAYLPVKHLHALYIGPLLGGPGGGGSNGPPNGWVFPSFNARENDAKIFVEPLQVSAIIEADALPRVLASLVSVSFFTPVRISYKRVPANPNQRGYVYGSRKLLDVQIDLEAYYLHSVFGKWMPADIQPVLTNPAGADLTSLLSGGGAPAGPGPGGGTSPRGGGRP